jgi:hypothetical protein
MLLDPEVSNHKAKKAKVGVHRETNQKDQGFQGVFDGSMFHVRLSSVRFDSVECFLLGFSPSNPVQQYYTQHSSVNSTVYRKPCTCIKNGV